VASQILSPFLNAIAILVMFGIVILIHEFGHFWVAKKLGIRVETFSFGFGPKLFKRKRGDTEYAISAFPFGGYVKMAGEDSAKASSPDEYASKSPGHRALVVVSGGLHNIIVAFFFLIPALALGIYRYDGTRIGWIAEDSPAQKAGIRVGDVVLAVNNAGCREWFDVLRNLAEESNRHPGMPVRILIGRDGQKIDFSVTPELRENEKSVFKGKKRYIIGISPATELQRFGFPAVITESYREYIRIFRVIFKAFALLFTREVSFSELSGPIGIGRMTIEIVKTGLASFFHFVALININLGIINLVPFPMLDGGHAAGLLGERITRRRPSKRFLEISQYIGLIGILILAIYVTYNDIMRIFAEKMKQ
jgi:regulator of sigma E protease